MSNRFSNPFPSWHNDNGVPLVGGTLTFYLTGTSTPTETYDDQALGGGNANPNPITLDAGGRSPVEIWLDPSIIYKCVLKDANGAVIRSYDPVVDPAANVTAAVRIYAGDPNGNVAGNAGTIGGVGASMIYDVTNNLLWICTTTGNAATAVWEAQGATLGGVITITGIITPASLSADQNNYNPTGFSTASVVRQDSTVAVNVTGLAGGATGRFLIYENLSAFNHILKDESSSSVAANRFNLDGDVTVTAGSSCSLFYDSGLARWLLVGSPGPEFNVNAIFNKKINFNGPVISDEQVLTVTTGTAAWDMALAPNAMVTLTVATAMATPTNQAVNSRGVLRVSQNGTGGFATTWASDFKFVRNITVQPALVANSQSMYEYWVRGVGDIVMTPLRRDDGLSLPIIAACEFNGNTSSGTYSRTGTLVTITSASHGLATGRLVYLDFTTGTATDGSYVITVTGANTYTVTDTVSGATSGNVTIQTKAYSFANISSIFRNGIGDYTLTMTTAEPDTNYLVWLSAKSNGTSGSAIDIGLYETTPKTTTTIRIRTDQPNSSSPNPADADFITVLVMRIPGF